MLAPIAQRLGLDQVQALGAFACCAIWPPSGPERRGVRPSVSCCSSGSPGICPSRLRRWREEWERIRSGCGVPSIGSSPGPAGRLTWCFWRRRGRLPPSPCLLRSGEALRALGAESALGARGGVHLVDPGEGFPTVLAWASARLPLELMEEEPEHWTPPPAVSVRPEPAPWHFDQAGSVVIRTGERLPLWAGVRSCAERASGWLTDETGNGLLWRENAHEGRLTRWKNDPLAVGGEERLLLETGGHLRLRLRGRGWPALYSDLRPRLCPLGEAVWGDPAGDGGTCAPGPAGAGAPFRALRRCWDAVHPKERWRGVRLPGGGGTAGRPGERAGERGGLVHRWDALPPERAEAEGEQVVLDWRKKVSALRFSTPEPALDRYLNGWALYQVLACRLMARTSQYQNGGAYGFRDQLQDVRALLLTVPERAREQLVLASSRQFPEETCSTGGIRPMGRGSDPDHRRPAVAALCAGGISGGDGGLVRVRGEDLLSGIPAPAGGGAGAV